MPVHKLVAERGQPFDEVRGVDIQVAVLETQKTNSTASGNDSLVKSDTVTSSAKKLTITESRPYRIEVSTDTHYEIKQTLNDVNNTEVNISDATTTSPLLAATKTIETYLQAGAEVSFIRASSDGRIWIIPA